MCPSFAIIAVINMKTESLKWGKGSSKKRACDAKVSLYPSDPPPSFSRNLSHSLASSPPLHALARFNSSVTTSIGLVTCHLASVRLVGCPTAVVKRSSGLSCSSTRGCSRDFPPSAAASTKETDSGGSIVYGSVASVNCNERNISSSVCRILRNKKGY